MSLSNGIQNYIDKVQEDTLSSYPITLQAESMDMNSMMTSLMGVQAEAEENQHEKDAVYSSTIMYQMMNSMVSADTQKNNLKAFKQYLESENSDISQHISTVQYSYDLDMNIYACDVDDNIVKTDILELMESAMSQTFGGNYGSFGWIGFHNGELELPANTEIPLLGSVTNNPWTYEQVVKSVGEFLCGVSDVDDALEGATFTVTLRLTNPENEAETHDAAVITHVFEASAPVVGE